MKNSKFAIIGCGYVAPKHMKAIKDIGGELVAILDPHDSVGIVDSYFPDCYYFREFERFDRFCTGANIDFVSICSPNYLHLSHALFGLRIGASSICEKPLALNPYNLKQLKEAEKQYGGRVWNILQLRYSNIVKEIKEYVDPDYEYEDVAIEYYTPRGNWYDYSWKADITKSGGIATNIGIHLFDILLHIFGKEWLINHWTNYEGGRCAEGSLFIGKNTIDVNLSIAKTCKPTRMLYVDNKVFNLSENFLDLHTLSYQKIIDGEGYGIDDVFPSIELCSFIREY